MPLSAEETIPERIRQCRNKKVHPIAALLPWIVRSSARSRAKADRASRRKREASHRIQIWQQKPGVKAEKAFRRKGAASPRIANWLHRQAAKAVRRVVLRAERRPPRPLTATGNVRRS